MVIVTRGVEVFELPTRVKEIGKKEASISVRVRAIVLERLKQMAEKHNLSQSEVIEHLVDQAFEEIMVKKGTVKKGNAKK